MKAFLNRNQALARIQKNLKTGCFGYVTGRRRVGKTALLVQACRLFGGLYHQAVEGTASQQLLHLTEEISARLPIFREFTPKTWPEFFRLLSREALPPLLVFDEFSYWIQGDPALASILQKWIDHDLPQLKTSVLISGSSQSMLYSQFLNHASALYGRAALHLHLEPLAYHWFCKALGYDASHPLTFARFSLVGGVPHYWIFMSRGSLLDQAQELYFDPSAILAQEPIQMIRDEAVTGTLPKAILDLVGRGTSKPSEIAARLGVPQGNLSRPLELLLELGFIHRELPFGESSRTTKKVIYTIQDPVLSFYYGVYLPVRSRWLSAALKEKRTILDQHVSRQWENFCRSCFPGSARYWERLVEIDLVRYEKENDRYLIAECKWKDLSARQKEGYLDDLRNRFSKTALSHRLKKVHFQVFTPSDLPFLAKRQQELE